jgi:hypothetical protein
MKLGEVTVAGKAQIPLQQVEVKAELASPELWLEVECLARFWRRRCFYCFTPAECPNGEQDWSIDFDRLKFSLEKVRYYESLLANRAHGQLTLETSSAIEKR